MLFYASEKYPEEGAYELYLAEVHTGVQSIFPNFFQRQSGVGFKYLQHCQIALAEIKLNFCVYKVCHSFIEKLASLESSSEYAELEISCLYICGWIKSMSTCCFSTEDFIMLPRQRSTRISILT